MTLVSSAFSIDPIESFIDGKQLVLFRSSRPCTTSRAASARDRDRRDRLGRRARAAFGIVQYGMLHYDSLGSGPGHAVHYMTYSGLLMLVICAAVARLVFGSRDRTWPALVMPALVVALSLTFGRSAWVGACVAVACCSS